MDRDKLRLEMEQFCCGNSICCEGLPNSTTVSTNIIPSLVTQNHDHTGTLNVYTIGEQPSKYRCRIPELQHLGGVHVHEICHGWMILSSYPDKIMWSLWNPATSKLIRLPPIPHKDDSDCIECCCLSSPPGDPSSILLLTRSKKPNFVFCRLVKRKKSRSRLWIEMSYANQLKRIMPSEFEGGEEMLGLGCLTCCNGKVYALSFDAYSVVQIDIKVVKDKQVVINILPFQEYPLWPYFPTKPQFFELKGCGTELFAITGRFDAPAGVYLFKLDMTTTHTTWEEINDLKDAVFFVDLFDTTVSVSYIPAVASGLGGYVHVRDDYRTIISSFHVKDKTLLLLPMPCLLKAIHVTMWEYRGLEALNDRQQVKCTNDHKQEEEKEKNDDQMAVLTRSSSYTGESRLLDVPFHVLEMIMEHCVGIEYINFRATCKRCHLAAPRKQWRNKTSLRKLHNYSLVSPWLMVVEHVIKGGGGIMNFTDPISGDKYLMKLRLSLNNYDENNSISCSKYGWLLFYTRSSDLGNQHHLVFFNPFTNDVRKLPPTPPHYLKNVCFSAPPTCGTDCMVVGFSIQGDSAYILRYVDQQEEEEEEQLLWHRFNVDGIGRTPYPYNLPFQARDLYDTCFRFPTFHGRDLYALCYMGQLVVFRDIMSEGSLYQPEVVSAEPPRCDKLYIPQYFLMEHDRYLLLVIVDKFGGDPQLFQFNDSTKEWNQIESLERHVIFIGDATCVCIEAKTPKMQNKIYFPRSKDGKLIFYSLETSEYHTFDGKLITREDTFAFGPVFPSTIHLSLHAWIEPTWY